MNDYLYRIRCSETGQLVADCGCYYCLDEFDSPEFSPLPDEDEEDSYSLDEWELISEEPEEEDDDPFWYSEYEEINEEDFYV